MQRKTGVFDSSFCKNTVYRFLNNLRINRLRFTTLLSSRIINVFMKPFTDENRKDVFLIDGSLFDRSRSRQIELLTKVFDHCSMKFKCRYRMLTLGWSAGNSFVLVNHCLLSAADGKNLLSVDITVGDEAIPAKIVCVRNKSRKKDWLAIICTDTTISEEEIICIYGKRWDIEVFFKACKSYLHLAKESRSLSYVALTAHVSIVFARYMMLSVT